LSEKNKEKELGEEENDKTKEFINGNNI